MNTRLPQGNYGGYGQYGVLMLARLGLCTRYLRIRSQQLDSNILSDPNDEVSMQLTLCWEEIQKEGPVGDAYSLLDVVIGLHSTRAHCILPNGSATKTPFALSQYLEVAATRV